MSWPALQRSEKVMAGWFWVLAPGEAEFFMLAKVCKFNDYVMLNHIQKLNECKMSVVWMLWGLQICKTWLLALPVRSYSSQNFVALGHEAPS